MVRSWFAPARRLLLKARLHGGDWRESFESWLAGRHPTVPLEQVERRLELVLMALYGRPIPIVAVEARAGVLARLKRMISGDVRASESTPIADKDFIELPETLAAEGGTEEAMARFRLLAIEQAERVSRGSAIHAPSDPLELDLYLVREGAAVDALIASGHPGLSALLERERRIALERRPALKRLTRAEREVELLYREALSGATPAIDASGDPTASLVWARETAARIRAGVPAIYRGVPPAPLWGVVRATDDLDIASTIGDYAPILPSNILPPQAGAGSTGIRSIQTGEEAANANFDGSRLVDDPSGKKPRDEEGTAMAVEAADDVELDRLLLTEDPKPNDAAQAGADVPAQQVREADGLPPGIQYSEWDHELGRYLVAAATVRVIRPGAADPAWSRDALRRHAAIVRQVRRQFESLRARRVVLRRQRAGDDLDVAACVDAIIDRRLGRTPDDRLYLDARPARQGISISLLVDTSGSTGTRVRSDLRVIDLERIALLLASEALDALGDLYAIHAFTGSGPSNVNLTLVKDFRERNGNGVPGRIAALEPGGFTRLGAAVRHATAHLVRASDGHRLLLILSDGRPNDYDRYMGPYGVEDSRQAIMEARASGVFPFCLTVDRDASEYLPRIFGTTGHTILQRPEQLPRAVLGVVRTLVRRS